ncbi:MAG: PilZ domain-containing protein [Candidatus Omnitrophica bacterium]|nr:PilZ domain-containing protein [Candidatus Omnitrophota bacterium]
MGKKEKRQFIRHPLSLPLAYEVVGLEDDLGGEESRTETINASIGGLLFAGKNPVDIGSVVSVKMPLEDKMFNVQAKVVRCIQNSETKLYDIAVSFFRLREAFKVKMIEQIYLISEYRDLINFQTGKEISLEEASRKWVKRYSKRFKKLYW